jgi:hypothetical protein
LLAMTDVTWCHALHFAAMPNLVAIGHGGY